LIVVVDSGIWISAIEFGGIPARAIEVVAEVDNLAICTEIEEEVLRILATKFGRSASDIRNRMTPIWESAIRVDLPGSLHGISRDPNDDFVIECAVQAKADILISGDQDLLTLKSYGAIRILTARQYMVERGGI
jgi:uncharacterized protein